MKASAQGSKRCESYQDAGELQKTEGVDGAEVPVRHVAGRPIRAPKIVRPHPTRWNVQDDRVPPKAIEQSQGNINDGNADGPRPAAYAPKQPATFGQVHR